MQALAQRVAAVRPELVNSDVSFGELAWNWGRQGARESGWEPGSAAGRAAVLADPAARVSTRDEVLTVGDFLHAYVLEWTLHHLDLIASLPSAPEPPAETLAATRELLENLAGTPFPAAFSDKDTLLIGTGRREPTDEEKAELGDLARRLSLAVG